MDKEYATKYHDAQIIANRFPHVLAGYIKNYEFKHTSNDNIFEISLMLCFAKTHLGFYTPTFDGDLRTIVPKIRGYLNTCDGILDFNIQTPDILYFKSEYQGNKSYCSAGYQGNKIIVNIEL